MVDVHDIGFTRLPPVSKECQDKEPHLNIVFIHGLKGHPRKTWEAQLENDDDTSTHLSSRKRTLRSFRSIFTLNRSKSATSDQSPKAATSARVFWPLDLLAEDVPEARIWMFGYNSDIIAGVFKANNKNSVSQHGQNLATRAGIDIKEDNEDPIVFVAHSLGGIIVKDALRRSAFCRSRTKMIIFLGTPHRGSAMAGWAEIASNMAQLALQDPNKKVVEALGVNSEVLDNIHEEFKAIPQEYGIKIHSFQEARPISGIQGLQNKVVDDFSSKLDLPRQFETVESIDADHRQMAKCRSKDDQQYRAIRSVLQQFIHNEMKDRNASNQETPAVVPKRASTSNANCLNSTERFDGDSISDNELADAKSKTSLKGQARTTRVENRRTTNYEPSSWNRPSIARCYRCDNISHKAYRCNAYVDTVLSGREERRRTGRCLNCGLTGHYRVECDFHDFLFLTAKRGRELGIY